MGFPATTKAGGMFLGMPNVCLTPAPPSSPVPVPYPSIGQVAASDGVIDKVLVENKETVVETSKVPNTSGDEAGTNGGVMSGTNMKQAAAKVTSSKVFFGGKKCVFQTATISHNNTSANQPAGRHDVPSQTKVIVGM